MTIILEYFYFAEKIIIMDQMSKLIWHGDLLI